MSDEDEKEPFPVPFSWDAVAAELAATREEAERRGEADPGTWDAVAAELAARVTERPADAPPIVVVPVEDDVVVAEVEPEPQPEPEPDEEPLAELDPDTLRGGEALLVDR